MILFYIKSCISRGTSKYSLQGQRVLPLAETSILLKLSAASPKYRCTKLFHSCNFITVIHIPYMRACVHACMRTCVHAYVRTLLLFEYIVDV